MKKIIFVLICIIFLSQFISAEILINQQPEELYNLGDRINIPMTITTISGIYDYLQISLICNGEERKLFEKIIDLEVGGKKIEEPVFLIKKFIGLSIGTCKIKASFESTPEDYILTKDFTISNLINIRLSPNNLKEFAPEENVLIEGEAIKENGEPVDGFIELKIFSNNMSYLETISNGFFSISFYLSKDTKAGQQSIKLNAYEKDPLGEITNQGFISHSILIKQVPTNLEIMFENSEIEPGTNLRVKAVLRDQTGEKINSSAILTIKNKDDEILEQIEKSTDEFMEFPIQYNEPQAEWIVVAVSNKLTNEATCIIIEKEDIKTELMNKTIVITNIGNVPYNKTVLIKIGNESVNINIALEVDEIQKYILTAPDGEYEIEIITETGDKITGMATLTGRTIKVKKASGVIKYSVVWIFIIAVLGFITFIIFKKGYKKTFFGYIHSKKREKGKKHFKKSSLIDTKNRAELSLSLKGEKQNVSLVCLKIKNFKDIISRKKYVEETLQKISDIAEKNKAVIYESQDNLFFISAPIKTKTFKNEKTSMEIAQQIKEVLTEHNKLFKQRIEYGISLNYGTIIAKSEKTELKFMSMGTLITTAKKIASLSDNEIFLSEKINERLISDAKTQKHHKKGITVYTIKEIKHKEDHKKFIKSFLERIEKKK